MASGGTEEAIPEVADRQPSSLYFIESKQNETISVCCLGLTVMPVGIASRCLIWLEPYTCQLTRHPSTSLHVKLATCRPALPHPSPFQIRESVGRPTMEAAQEIDELPFFMCELAHRPIRHVGGFSKFTFIYNCQSVRELHEAFPNHFPGIEARDILFCTKKTPQILSNNIIKEKLPPIYTVVFAHVRGPEKEVKLVKTRRKLGLKILNHFGEKNFIVKIDHENLGFHASPMLQVGDFIRAINGVSMEGKSNVEVQRAFWKLPFGKEVEIRIVSPKRGTLLSYAPRKCCWNL
ncbi:hypothetical protein L596_017209 [Steinernema carpocapsae]|uniref:PDZ domain-containing protein n=1 Tax=Steinernema carpocapsae TaxID=34508 RepID=A0A4U5N0Y0_STECR|nr:hypothetical protein L596_017209 [Steinernema carpocapsae]